MLRSAVVARLKRVPGLVRAYRVLRTAWWRLPGVISSRSRQKRHVAAVWGKAAVCQTAGEHARAWLSSAQVLREYVFPQLGGLDWYSYLRERCRPLPRQAALSLCCGDGSVERRLVKLGISHACEGIDISPEAIAVCRREAESAGLSGLSYRVADVETLRLPPDAYDLVIAWMALHHVEHVLRLVQEVKRALRPGGVFVVNEYVGPARFQMPGAQASLINEWLMRLPEELRRTPSGEVRDGFTPPTIEEVIAADPSEAVNSDQILPALERCFSTLERTDYGGPLLNWLLHDLTQNFDPENDEHRAWLQRLFAAEREVLNSGQLKSDFSFVIAEKPDGDGVTR